MDANAPAAITLRSHRAVFFVLFCAASRQADTTVPSGAFTRDAHTFGSLPRDAPQTDWTRTTFGALESVVHMAAPVPFIRTRRVMY